MDEASARSRFALARVARLASVREGDSPHLVPIVFAPSETGLVTAVDNKPKSTSALQRLANIAGVPFVSVLVDEYDEDWTQLWWARADGWARVLEGVAAQAAIELLVARYRQYQADPPPGPVIEIRVERWSGWSAAG
jgi:PPOX class probable F420-dependent enzyme